jgi:hypothetical protein
MFRNAKIVGVGVNPENYHEQKHERCSPEFVMSSSSARLFLECPERYKNGYTPPDSDAMIWGNLLDTLVLLPEQFESRYAVKPLTYKSEKDGVKPWNGNSNVCKQWLEDHKDLVCISNEDYQNALTATKRLMSDETIAEFINCSDKQVHVVGEWFDKKTGLIIPVQCLLDLVPKNDSPFRKTVGDLKTTRNAGVRQFGRWCFTAGYHVQAAWGMDLYMAAVNPKMVEDGEERLNWNFILSENYPPYQTGRRTLSEDFIQIGRQTYQHALKMYALAMKSGNWRGYDIQDEFTIIAPEPWQEFSALEDAMENSYIERVESGEENHDVPMP